jgi:DNA-binding MarR family transcriptional regulator
MRGYSEQAVEALRTWLQVTLALYSTDAFGRMVLRPPLSMMLLVYVWIQPGQSASYSDLRTTCKLDHQSMLIHAIKLLIKRGFAKRICIESDWRSRGLQLLEPGRNAIARLLNRAAANEPPPR